MKTVTGLLLAAFLAVCQAKAFLKVPAFETGKEYVYDYQGRVATGTTEEAKSHYSAFGFKSQLHVYTKNDHVYFKFADTKFGRADGEVEEFFEAIPMEYAEADYDKLKEVKEYMEKPFSAVFEDGVFKDLYSYEDNYVNLRKAIVGVFQTTFHPEEEHDPHMYSVYEDGIGGLCKTVYKVGHFPEDEETDPETVLNVTKIRMYDDCKNRPHLFFTSAAGYKCEHCEEKDSFKPYTSLGRTQYYIKGNKQQFTIEKIYSTGAISFTPYGTHGQSVISVVNQTAFLYKVEDATTFEVSESDLKKYDSLSYKFHLDEDDEDHELTKAHYYDRVYHNEITGDVKEELLKYVHQLAKDFKEKKGRESNTIISIIYKFYKFSYEDFKEFFEKNVNFQESATKEEKTIRYVLFEILPFVGTNPSFKYMLELIEQKKVDQATANEMIYKTPFYVKKPSKDILEYFWTAILKDSVKQSLKTWNTGLLAYGTLLNKACVESYFNPHPEGKKYYGEEEWCKSKVEEMIEEFEKTEDKHVERAYLRALRNTKHPLTYKLFMKIAKDEKYSALTKQTALFGLLEFTEQYKDQISGVAASIYFNLKEDYVYRIMAYEILLDVNPSKEFFGSLILNLHSEPNQKVASYVYGSLETFSNVSDPCYEYLKDHSRYVLKYVKPPTEYDVLRHSYRRIFSVYNEKYNYGRSTEYAMVPSEHSALPREAYLRQSFNVLGYNFDFFEFVLSSDEYSEYTEMDKYFLPKGLRSHDEKHADHVKKVVEKLNLDKHEEHTKGDYELSFKMFNHFVKYSNEYEFTQSHEMTLDGDKAVFNMHSVAYTEAELIVPNELGFPTVLMTKIPLSWHLTGSAKVNPRYGEEGYMGIQGVNVDTNLVFGVDITKKSKMFVMTPAYTKYGYMVDTKAGFEYPIKGSFDYDCTTKKLAIKYTPSVEKYEVFHYDTTPYAIFPYAEDYKYKPISYSESPVHREYNFGQDYFGVGLKFNFTYDYDWNDYGSYREFFKSFFKKDTTYEDYWYLLDKWYAGTRSFIDYSFLNPTAKPFHVQAYYEPSEEYPTTEFYAVGKYDYSKRYESEYGWESCKVELELTGKGKQERKWKTEWNVNRRYPEADFAKKYFHFERSALPNYDDNKFELCYKSNVTYENYQTVFSDKPQEVKVKYYSKLSMGKDCNDEAKTIYFKVYAEQSDEQKELDKTTIDYYNDCKKDVEDHNAFTFNCWKVMKDLGRVDKFTFDIDYKNIPVEFKGFMHRLYSYFRHVFYNNLYIDHFHGTNEENHLKIVANFSYEHPVLDVKVYRPDQTVYYNKVYVPQYFPKYSPLTVTEDFKDRYLRKAFRYNTPMCFISGDHFRTFDQVTYKLPHKLGSCWHLAFGDCKDHHFFVFYKKAEYNPYGKAMKVMFGNDVLVVTPTETGKYDITLNGEEKSVDSPVTFEYESKEYGHKVYVSKWGKGIYIESKAYGVQLYFDGVNGSIFTTNFYKGRQCGYCGNFDGEYHHEIEGPDGKYWKELDDTHNYAVEKDGCTKWDM